jgi:glycosyltransferase involved in cell wall biosynthesis
MTENVSQTILLNSSYAPSLLRFRGKLIEALVARGHRVHVTGPAITPDLAVDLAALGAIVHMLPLSRLGLNPVADLRYVFSLWRLIRQVQATLVINYTIKPNIWGAFAARLALCRSVSMVTGLGYAFAKRLDWKQRVVSALSLRLYAAATSFNEKIVFQNPDDLIDFKQAGCLADASKAILVNGSGINIDEFQLTPLPDRPVFLMIARFLKAKGLREYGKAVHHLQGRRNDCRFLLVGFPDDGVDGLSQAELDDIFSSGIENLGQMQDVRPVIALSSIYVLPSYREGTPRTVLEAMAMGRAIITTDAPGCRETVEPDVNGLLVDIGNSQQLAAAMESLADDKARVARMGKASRMVAERKYDVVAVNQYLIDQLGL